MGESSSDTGAASSVAPLIVVSAQGLSWGYGGITNQQGNNEITHRLMEPTTYIAPMDGSQKNAYSGEIFGGSAVGGTPVHVVLTGAHTASVGVQAGKSITLGIQGTAGDDRLETYVTGEAGKYATARPQIVLDGGAGNGDVAVISTEQLKEATITQVAQGQYHVSTKEADYYLNRIESLELKGQEQNPLALEQLALSENKPVTLSAAMQASLNQFRNDMPWMNATMAYSEAPASGEAVSPTQVAFSTPDGVYTGR